MIEFQVVFPSASECYTIHTWKLRGRLSNLNYDEFLAQLCARTKSKNGKFFISWFDGTDYCTITTSKSLRDALIDMKRYTPECLPKIYVSPVVRIGDNTLPSFFGNCRPQDLPKDFRDKARNAESSTYDVTNSDRERCIQPVQFICHDCQKVDWPGSRFTCVVCPQMVLCPQCYRKNSHFEHPLIVTRQKTAFPCPVLTSVKNVASDLCVEDSDEDDSVTDQHNVSSGRNSFQSNSDKDFEIIVDNDETEKIDKSVRKLREMGFQQDNDRLIRVAIEQRGDIESMIERLHD